MRAAGRVIDLISIAALLLVSTLVTYSALSDDVNAWYAVTLLGEEQVCMVLALTLYVLVDAEVGAALAAVTIASGAVCSLLKEVFALPRPPPESWRIGVSGYAFPSGHATTSAAFWCTLSMIQRSPPLALFSALAIASASYSRLALGVHHPRDVVAGVLIGVAISAISHLIYSRLGLRRQITSLSSAAIALGLAGGLLYGDINSCKVAGAALPLLAYPYLKKYGRSMARAGLTARVLALTISLAAAATALRLTTHVSTGPAGVSIAYLCAVALALYMPPLLLSITSSPPRRRP
ncbi:MAG: hypothetical protein DRK00_01755 [Thermoprotei archaeon]|mgnify:CR=1 FL=1|nr:MAG: hypothetical protein DRK00_01755 [Thermoprotei archaeon]